MQTTSKLVAVAVGLLATGNANACPTPGTGNIQQIVEDWVNATQPNNLRGLCAVAMDKYGNKGFACRGKADASHDLDHNTLFFIGSITKTMTATLLAKRVAEGTFNLDHYLNRYLPTQYRSTNNVLKIRDLASHHSGLQENADEFLGPARSLELLKDCLDDNCQGPNTYDYSNWGFQVLGYALAHSDGYGITNWFRDVYYNVLALNTMYVTKTYEEWQAYDPGYFDAHDAHKHTINSSNQFVDEGNPQHERCMYGTANPSGCLYSSPHDMRLYLEYVMGLRTPTQKLGDARNLMRDGYAYHSSDTQVGLAWYFRNRDSLQCHAADYVRVFKSGDITGQHSWIGFLQDPDHPNAVSPLGVVVMTNSEPKDGIDVGELGQDLLSKIPVP